jgi:hypothetical protein
MVIAASSESGSEVVFRSLGKKQAAKVEIRDQRGVLAQLCAALATAEQGEGGV